MLSQVGTRQSAGCKQDLGDADERERRDEGFVHPAPPSPPGQRVAKLAGYTELRWYALPASRTSRAVLTLHSLPLLLQSNAHRWQRPKPIPVGATTSLSLEQQQILAAVPVRTHRLRRRQFLPAHSGCRPMQRWKKAWVRPSNLRPGQNPNYKSAHTASTCIRQRQADSSPHLAQSASGSSTPTWPSPRAPRKRCRPRCKR